jgi:hypothetical protein
LGSGGVAEIVFGLLSLEFSVDDVPVFTDDSLFPLSSVSLRRKSTHRSAKDCNGKKILIISKFTIRKLHIKVQELSAVFSQKKNIIIFGLVMFRKNLYIASFGIKRCSMPRHYYCPLGRTNKINTVSKRARWWTAYDSFIGKQSSF